MLNILTKIRFATVLQADDIGDGKSRQHLTLVLRFTANLPTPPNTSLTLPTNILINQSTKHTR